MEWTGRQRLSQHPQSVRVDSKERNCLQGVCFEHLKGQRCHFPRCRGERAGCGEQLDTQVCVREFAAGRGKWELCTLTVGGLEGLHDPSKRLSVCEAREPHGESLGWKESQEIGKEAYGVEGKSQTLQCLETK